MKEECVQPCRSPAVWSVLGRHQSHGPSALRRVSVLVEVLGFHVKWVWQSSCSLLSLSTYERLWPGPQGTCAESWPPHRRGQCQRQCGQLSGGPQSPQNCQIHPPTCRGTSQSDKSGSWDGKITPGWMKPSILMRGRPECWPGEEMWPERQWSEWGGCEPRAVNASRNKERQGTDSPRASSPLGTFFFFSFLFSFFFSGLHPWRMDARDWIGTTAASLPHRHSNARSSDPSSVCDLHHSSWQGQILNPWSEAGDRTGVLMDTRHSRFHFCCTTEGTPLWAPWFYPQMKKRVKVTLYIWPLDV